MPLSLGWNRLVLMTIFLFVCIWFSINAASDSYVLVIHQSDCESIKFTILWQMGQNNTTYICFHFLISNIDTYFESFNNCVCVNVITKHAIDISRHLMCFWPCIIYVEKKNQPDATQWFIELLVLSTCFGHSYAHLQEHATIQMVTATLVGDGR
jgi:hypothetical protein